MTLKIVAFAKILSVALFESDSILFFQLLRVLCLRFEMKKITLIKPLFVELATGKTVKWVRDGYFIICHCYSKNAT